MLLKLLLGLFKGAVVGGGIGYGAYAANMGGGFHWLTYGLIGVFVGLIAGRPIWSLILDKRASVTGWTALPKAIVGYIFGVAVYAIVAKAWGAFDLTLAEESRRVYDWQYIMGGFVGALYGIWVEIDDAIDDVPKTKRLPAKK